MNPVVVDLSHYDYVADYDAMKAGGVVGVIYKATQGVGAHDKTYERERQRVLKAGLKWGAYHFGDNNTVSLQVTNFLGYAQIDPESLFSLDYEENGSHTMSLAQAQEWIAQVEDALGRPGECVIYSGNLIKEQLGDRESSFFGKRRLWHAQYGRKATVHSSWDSYWLWQYSGDGEGPEPHSVDGIDADCDCNHYAGKPEQLAAEWASGICVTEMPEPGTEESTVTITIDAPANVKINIVYVKENV